MESEREIQGVLHPKGRASVKCYLEKNAYQPDEVINIKLSVNNMLCIERVRNIIVRLKREIKG